MAQCYICGTKLAKKKNREKDHIPPECIFPENNKPPNLLTVLCCTSCHDEFDILDEKMRNYLAVLDGAESGDAGTKAQRAVLRSPKLRQDFISHTKPHPSLQDDHGNPRLVFYFEDEELQRWLVRIVKGLFFRKYKQIMEQNLLYKIGKFPQLTPQPSMTFPMEEGLEARPYFVCGVVKESNLDCWVLIFYDRLIFTVTVEVPKD